MKRQDPVALLLVAPKRGALKQCLAHILDLLDTREEDKARAAQITAAAAATTPTGATYFLECRINAPTQLEPDEQLADQRDVDCGGIEAGEGSAGPRGMRQPAGPLRLCRVRWRWRLALRKPLHLLLLSLLSHSRAKGPIRLATHHVLRQQQGMLQVEGRDGEGAPSHLDTWAVAEIIGEGGGVHGC